MANDPTGYVVAIVDDDHRTLESLANLLESAGHEVRLHSSATMFWQSQQIREIDCLISDIGMPDMDGFELRRLALDERPDLPVILITGRPDLGAAHASLALGDRYFEKPFDGRKLLAAISAALHTTR